ncbi:MAG: hypothetical protein CME61_09325 [Halobacteriovoraceae bacterium]|nr:hypothetical protein [Halobacteriovoraceae bacterium]
MRPKGRTQSAGGKANRRGSAPSPTLGVGGDTAIFLVPKLRLARRGQDGDDSEAAALVDPCPF